MHLPTFFEIFFKNKEKTNLNKIKEVLENLGFTKNFKIINVVGTNGKGSVSNYLNQGFIQNNISVGLFTSPHLTKYNERILVNDKMISDEDFIAIAQKAKDICIENKLNWFSMLYVIAMLHFSNSNVEYVILEAGIGGEFDSTNTIDGEYGVVTSISTDHLDFLKSREHIPVDKSGIINEGMKFFMPSILDEKDKIPFRNKGAIELEIKKSNYQDENKSLAKQMFNQITGKDIKEFKTPLGRTTVLKHNQANIIIEVGHNEDGIKRSFELLKQKDIKYEQVVFSASKDKDDSIINQYVDNPFIWVNNGPKPKPFNEYKTKGKEIKDLETFIKTLDESTLFIGSFYLIEEVLKWIKQ